MRLENTETAPKQVESTRLSDEFVSTLDMKNAKDGNSRTENLSDKSAELVKAKVLPGLEFCEPTYDSICGIGSISAGPLETGTKPPLSPADQPSKPTESPEQPQKPAQLPNDQPLKPGPQKEDVYQTVKPGDNLWNIGKSILGKNVDNAKVAEWVKNISKINNLSNPDLIYPGQKLLIPGLRKAGS